VLIDPAADIIGQANIKFSLMVVDNVNAIGHRSWKKIWLRGRDLNPRPSGYEPDELPGCSTPHFENNFDIDIVQIEKAFVREVRGEIAILFAFAAACDFVET
jgi:hypothetical protein